MSPVPHEPDNQGKTPTFIAAENGHWSVVRLLLQEQDVNPNQSDHYGRTPLDFATDEGIDDVRALLNLAAQRVQTNARQSKRAPLLAR